MKTEVFPCQIKNCEPDLGRTMKALKPILRFEGHH